MAERNSWAVSDTGGVLTVEDGRLAVGALVTPGASLFTAKSGFRPGPGTPGAVTASGSPDANVHVAPFQLLMQSTRATAPGVYVQCLDATKDINILSTPADGTNPRDDLIVAQQSDKFYSDATNAFVVRQVVGTPAGVPADPTVSGSGDFIRLARVRVTAGATTITSGNITDLRATTGFGTGINLVGGPFAVGLGGLLPVQSKAQRDALVGVYDGLAVWRQDVDRVEIYNGSAWLVAFGSASVATVVTQETSASAAYVDLTTVGPTVSVDTGTAVDVTMTARSFNTAATGESVMSFAVSGASTLAAADARALWTYGASSTMASAAYRVTGLTAGTNVFTAKYRRVVTGTSSWTERTIRVQPV